MPSGDNCSLTVGATKGLCVGQSTARRRWRRAPVAYTALCCFPISSNTLSFCKRHSRESGSRRGFYDISSRTSYFYDSEPKNIARPNCTKITHQLFQELQRVSERLPLHRNFWALEGVAMYMESLRRHDHLVHALGGFAARRLQFARYRRLHEDFYVTAARNWCAIGRDAFQRDPRIRRLYSQSAGLTHWMIDDRRWAASSRLCRRI